MAHGEPIRGIVSRSGSAIVPFRSLNESLVRIIYATNELSSENRLSPTLHAVSRLHLIFAKQLSLNSDTTQERCLGEPVDDN